jgi:hypothetical protein
MSRKLIKGITQNLLVALNVSCIELEKCRKKYSLRSETALFSVAHFVDYGSGRVNNVV